MFLFNLNSKKPLLYTIFIFLFINYVLFFLNPNNNDDNMELKWGIGEDKILFPYLLFSFIFSIFTYLIINLFDLKYT